MQLNTKAKARATKATAATVTPATASDNTPASVAPAATAPLAIAAPVTSTALAIAPATVAASPRLTESDVQRLFAHLAATDSCPVKIGKNRGKHSSEALLAPHARVGVSARNIGAVIFAAIAQNIEIKAGAVIPRFFIYADTPLHVETGAGRNVLRGRSDKKSGAVTLAVTLDSCDSGDAFRVTESHATEFALIAPANLKAFKAALSAYA